MSDYTNAAQQRILKALQILAGNELVGITPTDLAKSLDVRPSVITRDLDNLLTSGLAERIHETGRWRLAPKLVQIAIAHSNALSRARARLSEVENRYSREP